MMAVGLLAFVAFAAAAAEAETCTTYNVTATGDYKLCWQVEDKALVLRVEVATTGWVAFGIGEPTSGSMGGADIATVEWGADGAPQLTDRYATDKAWPPADPCGAEEWTMDGFARAGGKVTGTLRRALRVGSTTYDRDVLPGRTRILLAYGAAGAETLAYHGARRLVHAEVFVASPLVVTDASYDTAVDLRVGSFAVPAAHTVYAYRGFDLLDDALLPEANAADHHLVGFEVLDDSHDKPHILHHVIVWVCNVPTESFRKVQQRAQADEFDSRGCAYETVHLWAPGVDRSLLPLDVGFRIGRHSGEYDKLRYFGMEMHYDNPQRKAGVDNSGFRLLLTRKLRPHDAMILMVGDADVMHRGTVLPVGQVTRQQHDCTASCTSRLAGRELTMVEGFLHMHKLGRSIRLNHHHGGGVDELLSIDFWTFDIQLSSILHGAPQTLRGGDELRLVCEFENTRSVPAEFGLGSDDEMCLAGVLVYPRTPDFSFCGPMVQAVEEGTLFNVTWCGSREEPLLLTEPYRPADEIREGPHVVTFGNDTIGCTAASPSPPPATSPAPISSAAAARPAALLASAALLLLLLQ